MQAKLCSGHRFAIPFGLQLQVVPSVLSLFSPFNFFGNSGEKVKDSAEFPMPTWQECVPVLGPARGIVRRLSSGESYNILKTNDKSCNLASKNKLIRAFLWLKRRF